MVSLRANHVAVPPLSRNMVPVWPSQSPLGPDVRIMDATILNGPGSVCRIEFATCVREACGNRIGAVMVDAEITLGDNIEGERTDETAGGCMGALSICTCILHFTSSMGVLQTTA